MKQIKKIGNFLHSMISSRGSLSPEVRMALRSQGAGRNEEHPRLVMGALFGGIGREAISDAEIHSKRDSIDGDLMFLFPVIEAILMATAVALTLVPTKQTNLSNGLRSVPPMFLKL